MTPPEDRVLAPVIGTIAPSGAVLSCLGVLRKRADFLRANHGQKRAVKGFILQARKRAPDEAPNAEIRVGFTCSKKVGNAVARNRAKRRLRALAQSVLPELGRPGWDYVLIGRAELTAQRDFGDLVSDLTYALKKVHA